MLELSAHCDRDHGCDDVAGGDGLASDLMWHEIREIAKEKPLVASMGDFAGSGGYYISMGAPTILAQPLTLTGSIGVFLARFNLTELYKKVRCNPFRCTRIHA
jgi:protease-4